MIQSVAAPAVNYAAMCVVILQPGRMLPPSPYLEYKMRMDPSAFLDTQGNFNQSTWCHILPSVILRLHIQCGTKHIMFSVQHEVLYSPYCSGKFSGIFVVLEAYSNQLRCGVAFNR
jgi:hypothetical protein